MSKKQQHLHICKVNGNLVAIIYKRSEMALCKWAFIIIDEHLSTMRDADEENVNENLMTCLPFKIALNGWPHHRECLKIAIRLSFDKLLKYFSVYRALQKYYLADFSSPHKNLWCHCPNFKTGIFDIISSWFIIFSSSPNDDNLRRRWPYNFKAYETFRNVHVFLSLDFLR